MEKQSFNPIQAQHWVNCGLSQADAEYLATVQMDYQISLDAEWEQDVTPENEFDKATAKQVRKQINEGRVWAWCSVKVSVGACFPADRDTEDEYLGCCSYADRNDFICGGYFVQMVKECVSRLESQKALAA